MSQSPTLQQQLDALRSPDSVEKRRREEAEKRRVSLAMEGWSAQTIKQRATPGHKRPDGTFVPHPLHGVIDSYADSQHPWGLEPPYSDRKSKRVRKPQKPLPDTWSRYFAT